jgi:hypothetical protein
MLPAARKTNHEYGNLSIQEEIHQWLHNHFRMV